MKVRPDHAQVERSDVNVVLDAVHLLASRSASCLHQLDNPSDRCLCETREIVIVGILAQAAVVERPSKVVDRISLFSMVRATISADI